jgi:hypothetical protein
VAAGTIKPLWPAKCIRVALLAKTCSTISEMPRSWLPLGSGVTTMKLIQAVR